MASGFIKKATSLDTYDHPLLFGVFVILFVSGAIYFLNRLAAKANIPGPSALMNQ